MSESIVTQEPPKPGHEKVYLKVMEDLVLRADFGLNKYGTHLMTNNGRDPLVDAYQEALDLVLYLKQLLLERQTNKEVVEESPSDFFKKEFVRLVNEELNDDEQEKTQ